MPANTLLQMIGVDDGLQAGPMSEDAWIEVIQKMDSVYAELLGREVELEQKNAELEQAREFIDSVLQSMTDVLIACDRHGNVERTDLALERVTGRSGEELIGTPVAQLFVASSVPLVEQIVRRGNAEQVIEDCEMALIDRHGVPVPLAVNVSSRHDHDGRLQGFVLIGRPVGELRRAYDQLAQTHRALHRAQQQLVVSEKMAALGRLVAGVAHELNNPISFVFGNMHALKRYGQRLQQYLQAIDQGEPADKLQELRRTLKIDRVLSDLNPLVEGTLEGAERVREIVAELRRFSSTQSEPSERYDLVRVVQTAVSWVVKAARCKPTLRFALPDSLDVVGRKGPLHQIVVNLVQNALDAMAELPNPALDISAVSDDQRVILLVRDHGPGIPPAHLARVFEPFFTTKKIGEGTGLGLYISYGLAEELGGSLSVHNHSKGGAEFALVIPLRDKAYEE